MAGFWGRLLGGGTTRGEEAARQLTALRERASARDLAVLHVTKAYQHTQRGTKAWVTIDGSSDELDSWFWNARVDDGQTVLAAASGGVGAHYNREHILYIGHEGSSGVQEVLPAGTRAAAERYLLRHPVQPAPEVRRVPRAAPAPKRDNEPLPKSVYAVIPREESVWRVVVNGQATGEVYRDYTEAVTTADRLRGGSRCWDEKYGQVCEAVEGHDGRHINYKDGHAAQPFMRWAADED